MGVVGGEEGERSRSGERSHSIVFYGAGALQLLIVNFHMKIQEPFHSYFIGKPNVQKIRIESLYFSILLNQTHLNAVCRLPASKPLLETKH
jgi:hypothetical protein